MKTIDYSELENKFGCACQDVLDSLSLQYKENYQGAGPGKLETFFELIKSEFDQIVDYFTHNNGIAKDKEAMRRIQAIAKDYARKCVEDYGKIK